MADGDQKSPAPEETRYPADYWAENADLLGEGVTGPAVVGALSGERREYHTKAQVEKAVKAFMDHETERAPGQPDEEE